MSEIHHTKQFYDTKILLLSFLTAYFGSYMAICLSEQLRATVMQSQKASLTRLNIIWYLLIGVSMGGVGIWGMHFMGMAAMEIKDITTNETLDVNFNLAITFITLIIVIFTISLGVYISSHDHLFAKTKFEILEMFVTDHHELSMAQVKKMKNWMIIRIMSTKSMGHLIVGGMVAAAGMCMMHYLGMASLEFHGHIEWNGGIVAASVLIAVLAATAGFWIFFRVLSIFPGKESLRQAAALLIAVGVLGMHYTGMAASTIIYETSTDLMQLIPSKDLHMNKLSGPLYVAITIVMWILTVIVFADLRAISNRYRKFLRRTHQLDQMNHSIKSISYVDHVGSSSFFGGNSNNNYSSSLHNSLNSRFFSHKTTTNKEEHTVSKILVHPSSHPNTVSPSAQSSQSALSIYPGGGGGTEAASSYDACEKQQTSDASGVLTTLQLNAIMTSGGGTNGTPLQSPKAASIVASNSMRSCHGGGGNNNMISVSNNNTNVNFPTIPSAKSTRMVGSFTQKQFTNPTSAVIYPTTELME